MDDVDATQGEIAKTMLRSGDWVTAHLDGVAYLEKAPLKYWITATLYSILGVHDWVARVPNALAVILLCLLVYRIAAWAGAEREGFYAGLVLSTSIGLFLFTRIVIPDVILTLAITLALWGLLRAAEDEGPHAARWIYLSWAAMGCAVLLKGLIGIVFPAGISAAYLLATGQLFRKQTWSKLHVFSGAVVFLAIAVPWHVLAIVRNPPYFDWTLHADPHFGYKFHGFFWFYFINDQFLRFTNGRWPRDYNTVPRLWFWLYHIVWFFPWSFFWIGLRRIKFHATGKVNKLYLLCVIWIALILTFFTFSTTQEYYSMPLYPAIAILTGAAMTCEGKRMTVAARLAGAIAAAACLICSALIIRVRALPTPGDIADALSKNPDVYTLALGHMTDLTFAAFAYLKVPLLLAAVAFFVGAVALWQSDRKRQYFGVAVMLALFFQAARLALVTFDPYLSSFALANKLNQSPRATLIFNGEYYDFSAIPFYSDYQPLLLNGRVNNLEYGSYALTAPHVFIDDAQFVRLWNQTGQVFLVTYDEKREHLEQLVGAQHLYTVGRSGGKQLLSNLQPHP